MKTFPMKGCATCGKGFVPTGPAAKFCLDCGVRRRREKARQHSREYRIQQGRMVGVGKGGANSSGPSDSQYHHGICSFKRMRKVIRKGRRYCERCGKDLKDAKPWQWVVHHRDHNREHNEVANFELLCKRCHQIEHKCWKSFQKKPPAGVKDVRKAEPGVGAALA